MSLTEARKYIDIPAVEPRIDGVLSVALRIPVSAGDKELLGAEFETDACNLLGQVWPGDACTPVDVTVAECVPIPPPPPPPPPPEPRACIAGHPDTGHAMTWVIDEPPTSWVGPFTIDWGDGTLETSNDGEEAHEYAGDGWYIITFSDSDGHTCRVAVETPHMDSTSHACFDPTPLTVAAVIEQLGDDVSCAAGVLHLELANKNRTSLVAHLEGMINGDGG